MSLKNSCHSCLMPFKKDSGKRESDIYCSLCFKNRELLYKGTDLKEFKQICRWGMAERGINQLLASFHTFLVGFAPRWRKKS